MSQTIDLEKALSGAEVNSSEKAVAEIIDALDNINKKRAAIEGMSTKLRRGPGW